VVFLLAPLTIITGAAMSPAVGSRFPWVPRMFGGRQGARSVHFLCLLGFVTFTAAHTLMVVVHGLPKELGKMWMGTEIADPRITLLVASLSLAALVLLHWLATHYSISRPRVVQQTLGLVLHRAQASASHSLVPTRRLAPQGGFFRVNGYPPADEHYRAMAEQGFRSWRLEVGGLVEQPLSFSLDDLRSMPCQSQTTEHSCIQGWTAIGEWRGVALAAVLDSCRPLTTARHVALFALDDKSETAAEGEEGTGRFYETIPLALARHEQTLLAYELDGKPLSVPHGAPLRLRVENQLGFKMVKWIARIELIDDYSGLGKGQGGWREDNMFYSPAVAI
jgi:sulfoxide reductase catalytic subunit YedY